MTLSVSSPAGIPVPEERVPPLRPERGLGPVQARLRRRAITVYLVLAVGGWLPTLLAAQGVLAVPPSVQAFGLGLLFPGGGLLALGGPWSLAWAVLAYALFFVLRLGWSLTGMLLLPLLGWLGPAVLAALVADGIAPHAAWSVPLVAALIGANAWRADRAFRARARARGERRAAALPDALAALDVARVPVPRPETRELTPEALAGARYLFDRALQPVGQLEGFSRYDNFQLCALRYQLNYISYGLAMMQCHYTPNFHGYLNEAQRFAIDSLALPEVCGYWKWESWFGGFRASPDPVGRDNVMLTGWSLPPITVYAANTGDLRYQQPGALSMRPFRSLDVAYPHDANSFVASLDMNWSSAPYAMYPCEPHWSFPICNAFGMCGVVPYDRVNGTGVAAKHFGNLLEKLEDEFLMADGDAAPVRNDLTGMDFVIQLAPASVGMLNELAMATFMTPLQPGLARRAYAIARQECFRLDGEGFRLRFPWQMMVDVGNYSLNPGLALATVAMAAREQGDDGVAEAALREADKLLTRADGPALSYRESSCSANVMLATARWMRRDDWRRLVNEGPDLAALRGPLLTGCRYPDVLVARAMSDGEGLDLVLYNGGAAGVQSLGFERLKPGESYRALPTGETLRADAAGRATMDVRIDGRTVLRLVRDIAEA